MAHLVIEDVRRGIDTRRYSLASPDGTLTEGVDGHITAGGNFEKRKAFYPITLPAGSFGLQPVAAGLQVYGSGADPGGWPNDADGVAITYQRLQHPAVLAGESYSAGSHAMSSVVFSDVYGGYAFVIAQFADGKRYCYYNGTLVYDFTDGLILSGRTTLAEIAADFDAIVDRTGIYTATNDGISMVTVTGPAGVKYQAASTVDTAGNGDLTTLKASDPVPAVAANAATASFKIMAGSSSAGVNKITKVEVNGVTITNAAVDWTTSNEATAALIAASINTKPSSPEYTAEAVNNLVIIKAAESVGDTPNNFTVTVTAAGNVCIGDGAFVVSGTSFTITSLQVDGTNLLSTVPGYPSPSTTLSAFITAVAADINDATGTHGIVACGVGATLYLSKAVTTSDDAPLAVAFVMTGDGAFTQVDGTLASIPALSSYIQIVGKPRPAGLGYIWDLNVQVSGGQAPYHYEWATSNPLADWRSGGDQPNASIYAPNWTDTVVVWCTITDNMGSIKKSPLLTIVVP